MMYLCDTPHNLPATRELSTGSVHKSVDNSVDKSSWLPFKYMKDKRKTFLLGKRSFASYQGCALAYGYAPYEIRLNR